jgi:hypothetical protein
MPKILVLVNEAWPVYSFGSVPDELDGTEVSQEQYSRWSQVIREYQKVQRELETL